MSNLDIVRLIKNLSNKTCSHDLKQLLNALCLAIHTTTRKNEYVQIALTLIDILDIDNIRDKKFDGYLHSGSITAGKDHNVLTTKQSMLIPFLRYFLI